MSRGKKFGYFGWLGCTALAVAFYAGQSALAHVDPIAGPQLCSSVHPHLAADANPECGGADLSCSTGFECTPNSDDISDGDVWDVFGDGSCVFEFTVRDASENGYAAGGPVLDFVATGCSVEKWISKGGPNGANLYNFLVPLTSEECLHSPKGPNEKLSGLSHVTACVKRKISISGKKEESQGNTCPSEITDCNTIVGPLANWTIELQDGVGNVLDTTTTNSDGEYKFDDLALGLTYVVCEVIPATTGEPFSWVPCFPADGNPQGSDRFCYDPFTANGNVTGKDFRNVKQTVCTDITGTKFCDENGDGVFDPTETGAGMDGFCIILTEADGTPHTDLTDGAGQYEFLGIESGQTVAISEDLDGSSCASADKSSDWIETTPSSQNLIIPAGAATAAGPDVGNKSIPTITCPADVRVDNDAGLCTADVCFTPTASNLCGGIGIVCTATNNVTLSAGATAGEFCGTFPAGCPETTTVTCVATTDAGDTARCEFDVKVDDAEDPDATCGADATIECPSAIVFDACQFSDNCAFTSNSSITPLATTCPEIAKQRQTCTVEDPCGNDDDCTQTIRVVDTVTPTITCAANETHECPANPSFTDPTCIDACGCTISQTSDTANPGRCVSTETRCWEAADQCNTSDECCQVLTVEDTTKPTIDCPSDQDIDCDSETDIPVTATDTCQGALVPTCTLVSDTVGGQLTWSQLAGGGIRVQMPFSGSATFECNVSDGCGNDADPCRFTVTAECLECRFTGGGNDGRIPPKSRADDDDDDNAWTMGGQAGAPSASDPAFGEWTHQNHRGNRGKFTFHAGTHSAPSGTLVEVITCSDPLSCHQARPAPAKQLDFSGIGSIKHGSIKDPNTGATLASRNDLVRFAVHIEDSGEPGNQSLTDQDDDVLCPQDGHAGLTDGCEKCECADFYMIEIYNMAGDLIYTVDGYIHGGNFQIHPLVGTSYHGPTCE